MIKEFGLSLICGWVIGIIFSWFKLPLPAPPLAGLFGLIGMILGRWCWQQLQFFLSN